MTTLGLSEPAYKVGDLVEFLRCGEWHAGTVEDVFVGPVTGELVYVNDRDGFYSNEVRTLHVDGSDVIA